MTSFLRQGRGRPFEGRSQRRDLARCDDSADIAIGPHEHPIASSQGVGITEVHALVDEIAVNADRTDVQFRPRPNQIAFDLLAKLRPIRNLEKIEQACRLAGSAANQRIGDSW